MVAGYSSENVVAVTTLTATVMAVSVDQSNNELSGLALATASVRLLAPGSAMVSVSPVDIAGTGVTQTSNIVISNLKDVDTSVPVRSEERRVGKECRSWWGPYQVKKKRTMR